MNNGLTVVAATALLGGLMALVLLVACEPKAHGPALTGECPDETTIVLTVKVLPSNEAIERAAGPFGITLEARGDLLGFATKMRDTNRHTIYVTAPRGQRDHERIETWGHELMHSVCGKWHP